MLGLTFIDLDLLEQALTHPSAATNQRPHNQRLEFLGDRVLGLTIAEALFETYPDEAEGALAPRFNELVRKETCAAVAAEIGLTPFVRVDRPLLMRGGRKSVSILGDMMEALIAAIHLDLGDDVARNFVRTRWQSRIDAQGAEAPQNAKSQLQEWAQQNKMSPPRYRTTHREGPDHAVVFTIEARVETGQTASASASSKKAAEHLAAVKLLKEIGLTDE
ncbi:MAG: ribonuclease III [Pseudomonadota bacterium]